MVLLMVMIANTLPMAMAISTSANCASRCGPIGSCEEAVGRYRKLPNMLSWETYEGRCDVPQAEKVYVQHLMAQQGAELFRALSDAADGGCGSIFICGDGTYMVQAVHATLIHIFSHHGNMTEAEAVGKLSAMASSQRYVKDVWS